MLAWQFTKALYLQKMNGWSRFVSMQNLYNLLYREEEREMFPLCEDQKIGIIPWSPLAAGRLARKPNQEGDESQRAQTDTTGESLFERKDTSIAERDGVRLATDVYRQEGAAPAPVLVARTPYNSDSPYH